MAVLTTTDGKIAVFADPAYFSSAGIETYTRELIKGLAGSELAEQVVLVSTREEWTKQLRELTSTPGLTSLECVTYSGAHHVLRYTWSFAGLPAVERIVGEPLAFVHNPLNRRFPAACRELVTIHDVFVSKLPALLTWRQRLGQTARLERIAIGTADHLLADSANTKHDICELFERRPDDITVVPLGVDHEAFRPVAKSAVAADTLRTHGVDGPYILYVGSLYGRKLGRLLDAFKLFREMTSSEVNLVVVGGREIADPNGAPLRARIDELGLTDSIVVTGYVHGDDIPVLMSGAELFVYVSLYEGFGLSVLEAMSCGAPVVASDVSSIPEVVGDAGILVDPTDERAIASAMVDVIDDRELNSTLRARATSQAARFSWKRTVEETLKVYRRFL